MTHATVADSPVPSGTDADPAAAGDFGAVWAEVQPRLVAFLRRRGATRELAEDLSQEVALRCMTRRVPYADAEDLLRWCNVVSANLLVDHHRSSRRILDVEPPDVPASDDVFRAVDGRLALRRALRAMTELSATDQQALIESLDADPAPDRREATRLAVQRHRARVRLRAVIGGVLGWLLGLLRAGRRMKAPLLAPVVIAVPLLLILTPLVTDLASPERTRPPAPPAGGRRTSEIPAGRDPEVRDPEVRDPEVSHPAAQAGPVADPDEPVVSVTPPENGQLPVFDVSPPGPVGGAETRNRDEKPGETIVTCVTYPRYAVCAYQLEQGPGPGHQ